MSTTEVLSRNIADAIRKAKRDGVTGMSISNLRQLTSTAGLMCSPAEYNEVFPSLMGSYFIDLSGLCSTV